MNYIGLFFWVFVENFWIAISVLVLTFIFSGVAFHRIQRRNKSVKPNDTSEADMRRQIAEFYGASKVEEMLFKQKISDLYRFNESQEPSIFYRHRAKIIIGLLICHWFFYSVKPEWLPEMADNNRYEIKNSLYVTPVGVSSERGRLLLSKYRCAFWEGQRKFIRMEKISERRDKVIRFLNDTDQYIENQTKLFSCN